LVFVPITPAWLSKWIVYKVIHPANHFMNTKRPPQGDRHMAEAGSFLGQALGRESIYSDGWQPAGTVAAVARVAGLAAS
jgi:hypothetical protein